MDNPFTEIDKRLKAIEGLLQNIANNPKGDTSTTDEVGGIALAQDITGLKRSTIYCHVHKGIIPHFKRGGKLYFSKTDLLKWIKQEKPPKEADIITAPLFPRYLKNVKQTSR